MGEGGSSSSKVELYIKSAPAGPQATKLYKRESERHDHLKTESKIP